MLILFGSPVILQRVFHNSRDELSINIGFSFVFSLALSLLLILIGFVVLNTIELEIESISLFFLAIPLLALANAINAINTIILRNEEKAAAYFWIVVPLSIFQFGGGLLFITLGFGWQGMVYGLATGLAVLSAAGVIRLWRKYGLKFEPTRELFREKIHMGGPAVLYVITSIFIVQSDRFLLAAFASLSDVGIFAVGHRLGSVPFLVIQALLFYWSPWLYKRLKSRDGHSDQVIVQRLRWMFVGYLMMSLMVWPIAWLYITWFLDPEFMPALDILPWIAAATLFQGIQATLVHFLLFSGHTGTVFLATAFAGAVKVSATIILIPIAGIVGAAQGTLLAYALLAATMGIVVTRRFDLTWR